MGIEQEADRTLFVRNLDTRVTEELLFELFVQAGPLIRTKIPKDSDGRQKTFGFAVYKHEVSVPYAMQLLDGTSLFGKTLHVQFRSGSSHGSSPAQSQNQSPVNTPNPHGQRTPMQFSSPPYTPPSQVQRSFDNPQKHTMINSTMWQLHVQQMDHLKDTLFNPPMQQLSAAGAFSPGGSRHHDSAPYRQHPSQSNSSRGQRYGEDQSYGRQGRDNYQHHQDRSSSRHHDNRGGNKYNDRGDNNRGYQDSRRRRY